MLELDESTKRNPIAFSENRTRSYRIYLSLRIYGYTYFEKDARIVRSLASLTTTRRDENVSRTTMLPVNKYCLPRDIDETIFFVQRRIKSWHPTKKRFIRN